MFKHSYNGPVRQNVFVKDLFCLKQCVRPGISLTWKFFVVVVLGLPN